MASVFTKIINREIPAYIIKEDANYIAFLDAFPFAKGHVLVCPKKEVDQLFDLDDETYKGLMAFSKTIATALKKAFPCNRVSVLVEGLAVPHAHVHLFPIVSGLPNFDKKINYSAEEFTEIQNRIKQQLV